MTDWYPHVTVATVIERDGKYLLVEEQAGNGLVYNQPAGHLEAGESLAQAAIRETREETGYDIELQGVLGSALYHSPDNGVSYYRTSFYGVVRSFDPAAELDSDIQRSLWLTHREMLANSDRMRSPLVLATVEQYLTGRRWPLDFIYYGS
ncbi:MAG: NUDIX hydrolase [Halieaceae bacterium]